MVPDSGLLAPRSSSDHFYLDFAGKIQEACQGGSVFRLVIGFLFFVGTQRLVSRYVSEQDKINSAHIAAIDSIFAITADGTLFWNNDALGKLQIHTPNYEILTNSYPILHFHTPQQKNGV